MRALDVRPEERREFEATEEKLKTGKLAKAEDR
eukprot:SAG11_NODE_3942_length_2139_cov_2.230392_1_plen_32_part_10